MATGHVEQSTAYDIQSLTINESYVRGAGQSVKFGCFVMVKFQATVTSQLGSEVFATVTASHRPTSEVYPIVAKYTNASGQEYYYTNYINISASGTIWQSITGAIEAGAKIEATYLYKLN